MFADGCLLYEAQTLFVQICRGDTKRKIAVTESQEAGRERREGNACLAQKSEAQSLSSPLQARGRSRQIRHCSSVWVCVGGTNETRSAWWWKVVLEEFNEGEVRGERGDRGSHQKRGGWGDVKSIAVLWQSCAQSQYMLCQVCHLAQHDIFRRRSSFLKELLLFLKEPLAPCILASSW